MATGRHTRLTAAEGRRFGLLVGGVFACLGTWSWWRGHAVVPAVVWTLGALLLAGGALVPARLGPVYRAWMGLAHVLSRVTTPIVMGLVYFAVLTPIGLLRRAFGHNTLVRPRGGTCWIDRAPDGGRRSDLTRQF